MYAGIISCMIVFMKYSGNNKAATVYDWFLEDVHQYGLPSSCIWSYQATENCLVARHMLQHRGTE